MTVREVRREQLKTLKGLSTKEKLSYFWEYYGIKTICLVLALTAVIAFIVSMVTKKEYAVSAVFFGGNAQDSAEEYLSAFGQSAGIDLSEYDFSVQCQPDLRMDQALTQDVYNYMEAFTAMVSAKSVDCFAGNKELFLYYAYMEYALDLRTVLSQEELQQLSPYLHYIDGKLIEEQENADEGLADAYAQHPDSTKPEMMVDPIPVAVSLNAATEDFKNAYFFSEDAIIGICSNTEQSQNTLAFFRYCLDISR